MGTLGTSSILEKLWELKRFSKIFLITKVQNQHKWKRAAVAEKNSFKTEPLGTYGIHDNFPALST